MKKLISVSCALIAANFGGFMYLGCGGGDDASTADQSDASSGNDSSAPDSSADGNVPADSGPLDSGPFVPQTFSLSIPAVVGDAGTESTYCITKRLGNPGAVHIGTLHTTLASGSNAELVVYKVDDPVESPTPTDCQPLAAMGMADAGTALTVTQKADELLQFPPQDGFTLAANQMIRLELHAIDPDGAGFSATAAFTTMDDAAFKQEVGMVLAGLHDISIPAGAIAYPANATIAVPSVMAGTSLLLMSGHQHRLGTELTVSYDLDGGVTALYENPGEWNDPPLTAFAPPQPISAGAGFNVSCTWNNNTVAEAIFGEGAQNEECYFRAHYAPSAGTQLCLHIGGVDVCKP